ncbi:MAG: hypothetical protein LBV12_07025 [Puniceicoccales bacterium]|jgi:ABC-type transporter Mla subunit MlaD|nr:hypothetical protein [Puniceicoccales bacterium]
MPDVTINVRQDGSDEAADKLKKLEEATAKVGEQAAAATPQVEEFSKAVDETGQSDSADQLGDTAGAVENVGKQAKDATPAVQEFGTELDKVSGKETAEGIQEVADSVETAGKNAKNAKPPIDQFTRDLKNTEAAGRAASEMIGGMSQAAQGGVGSITGLTRAWRGFIAAMKYGQMSIGGVISVILVFVAALYKAYKALDDLTKMEDKVGKELSKIRSEFDAAAAGANQYAVATAEIKAMDMADVAKKVKEISQSWAEAQENLARYQQTQLELEDAEGATKLAALRLEEMTALADAPKEERSLIQAQFSQQRTLLQNQLSKNRLEKEYFNALSNRDVAIEEKGRQQEALDEFSARRVTDSSRYSGDVTEATANAARRGLFVNDAGFDMSSTRKRLEKERDEQRQAFEAALEASGGDRKDESVIREEQQLILLDKEVASLAAVVKARENYVKYLEKTNAQEAAYEEAIKEATKRIEVESAKVRLIEERKSSSGYSRAAASVESQRAVNDAFDENELNRLKAQRDELPKGRQRYVLDEKIAQRSKDKSAAAQAGLQLQAIDVGEQAWNIAKGFQPSGSEKQQKRDAALIDLMRDAAEKVSDGADGKDLKEFESAMRTFISAIKDRDKQRSTELVSLAKMVKNLEGQISQSRNR